MYDAYNQAVLDINSVVGQEPATARRDLAALKALIEVLESKLPPEGADYETDAPYKGPINQPCSPCSAGDTAMEYHDHDHVPKEKRRP